MRGRLPLCAEVLTRLHESPTKNLFPEAIDCHSGGEWIVGVHDPMRQAHTVNRRIFGQRMERRGHACFDHWALVQKTSPNHHICSTSLIRWEFSHDRNGGSASQVPYFANLRLDAKNLIVQRFEQRRDRAEVGGDLLLLFFRPLFRRGTRRRQQALGQLSQTGAKIETTLAAAVGDFHEQMIGAGAKCCPHAILIR